MIVAIGIIVFLAGVVVSALVAFVRASEVRRTEQTIDLLDMAVAEWEQQADRKLSFGDGPSYDLQESTDFVFVITEMLEVIRRQGDAGEILAQVDPQLMYVYHDGESPVWIKSFDQRQSVQAFLGGITVLDEWGTPLYATPPGSVAPNRGVQKVNADGTVETRNERWYGVARNRQVCFISAGPDRRFGLIYEFQHLGSFEAIEQAMIEARKDNIRSYPPAEPFLPLAEILAQ
jgi:type II secretory pathway pseudopilin PulG